METLLLDDVLPFGDWRAAARASLVFLHSTVGLDVWMVTRLEDPQQVVLDAHPDDVVPPGTTLPWERSFCRSMVIGTGPRVATVTAATPAYRDLRTGLAARVQAYIGVPLVARGGTLFGSLCGVSSRAQPRSLTRFLPQVEMTARMLSSLLPAEAQPTSSAAGIRDRAT